MTHELSDRTVLVTGSARGLGWTYARAFLDAGARVILHASSEGSLEQAREKAAAFPTEQWRTCSFDVSDAEQVEAGVAELNAAGWAPSVLVNNAGIQRRGNLLDLDAAVWDEVIGVNLSGAFYVGAAVGRLMREAGHGKIVNIGSVTTERARKGVGPYTAAKCGVHGLTQAMAVDFAEWNIQVNTLSPGYFRTDMNTALVNDPQFDRWLRDRTPADRWGEPEELVGAMLFLCSGGADFVTGQNLVVDGGIVSSL